MKKLSLAFALFAMTAITAFAQAPQSVNYQGVARNSSGTPLASAPIGLRLTVHDGSALGAAVYQETQTPTTNAFGLYNVAIGGGTVVTGTFAGISWGSGNKYLQVEIDPSGGTSYTDAGTSQLLSVPYSIYANNAGSAGTATTATTAGNGISGGTANYIPKFTSGTALGNSTAFDNGSTIGVNTTTPTNMARLHVSGIGTYSVTPIWEAGIVADSASGAGMASATGIFGEGGWRGVYGHNVGTSSGVQAIGVYGRSEGSAYTGGGYGVFGEAVGTGGTNYGVYGNASGGTTNNYGVYATSSGAGYAGYIAGNLHITGALSKGSGTFMIDHPLDPENKYLYHSFVESPDMMNIYNGNVTTDATGYATVTLPDYFEALNKDFRYQLTVIGDFAQAVISQKVNNNQFQIRTDKPNVEVSWQVTGVRHDKYADAHRVVPEVDKEKQYKGYYLHAAEWGMPADKSIDALTAPKPNNGDNKPTH